MRKKNPRIANVALWSRPFVPRRIRYSPFHCSPYSNKKLIKPSRISDTRVTMPSASIWYRHFHAFRANFRRTIKPVRQLTIVASLRSQASTKEPEEKRTKFIALVTLFIFARRTNRTRQWELPRVSTEISPLHHDVNETSLKKRNDGSRFRR